MRTGGQRPSRAGRGRSTSRGGEERGCRGLVRRAFVLRAPTPDANANANAAVAAGNPTCLLEAGGAGIYSLYAERPDRLYQAAL